MQSRQSDPEPGSKLCNGSPHEGQEGVRIFKEKAFARHLGHTLQSLRRETGVPQMKQLSGNSRFRKGSNNRSRYTAEKLKMATLHRL